MYFFSRGRRYYCRRCKEANKSRPEKERTTATFNAWDADVLAKMEEFVSKEFPFVLSKKAAISKSIVERLADDLLEGKGFAATAKSLEKAYRTTWMKRVRSYVSLTSLRVKKMRGWAAQIPTIPKFSKLEDPLGYNSAPPSAHYLRDIWHKWFYETPVVQVWGMS